MKKIFNFLKSRIVISIIGLIAFSILIWFIGPMIKFGANNAAPLASSTARLLAIIVVLVLWGLNNLRVQMQDKKNNDNFVDDLADNQKAQSDASSDLSNKEQEQIGARFSEALQKLKKTKFKGQGAHKSLYELPWYIIVGPPGSGKTTALVNSSLDFPLADHYGKSALQGIGGTRNCDWWFTNEAVLVDTAGRYTTQDSHKVIDSSGWEAFLNLLKRNRPRRPINGAIVAVSLQDLLIQSDEERAIHAKTIRNRLNELIDKFEIDFPVYLMLTKADMVSGFSEFFEDLGMEEREQVWGVSLPANSKEKSVDFDDFQAKFSAMMQRLYERVTWRVHQERDINRRGLIYGFPQQMDNLQSIISSFIHQAFEKNEYQSQPYLRGVYLTSGTQDGTPIDRLMTSVASSFGFSREAAHLQSPQGKSYFLGDLFKKVIFPESELVGVNKRYEKVISWSRRVGFAAMVGFSTLVVLIWTGSITKHELLMGDVQAKVDEYNQLGKPQSGWSKDLRKILPQLNALLGASEIYDEEKNPWLTSLGLYDDNVNRTADTAYQSKLRSLFLPRAIDYIAARLARGHQGGDLYNTFRVYLMFENIERMNKDIIIKWFENDLDKNMLGEASIRKQLLLHLKNLLSQEQTPSTLNERLVTSTRNLLLRVPVSQRIYERIRTNQAFIQPVELLNQFGESVRQVYKMSDEVSQRLTIPWMFTKEGYKSIDFSPESQIINDILNDSWILAKNSREKVDFMEDDFDKISEEVKSHYLSEYLQVWKNVYATLQIEDFRNLTHASESLALLTDPVYSPLLAVLHIAKENTELTPPLPENIPGSSAAASAVASKTRTSTGTVDAAGSLAGNLSAKLETKVDRQFKNLNYLLRESSQKMAAINQVVQNIQQLHDFVDSIQSAPEPGKQAFSISKARYLNNSVNAITSLRTYAKKMPDPIKSWLESLADQTWKVVLETSRHYMNAEWKSRVYGPYTRAIANGYPVNRNSNEELAVSDFSDFFKTNGALDSYYKEFISPFINSKSWSNKTVDDRNIGISKNVLTQVSRALQIKNIFFKNNPESPSLSFQMRPESMSKNDARFYMDIGGNRLTYNHGPKFWKSVEWNSDADSSRVRLAFEDLQGATHSKSYDGPWAWFRLQDAAELRSTSTAKIFQVKYSVASNGQSESAASEHYITYLIKAKSVNNPFSRQLLGGFRCPESL